MAWETSERGKIFFDFLLLASSKFLLPVTAFCNCFFVHISPSMAMSFSVRAAPSNHVSYPEL